MSGEYTAFAELVGESLDGQRAAQGALHDLAHTSAPPDLLCERLRAVMALGGHERLRSFCRTLQKTLEAKHAPK